MSAPGGIRTDLAVELREQLETDGPLSGVELIQETDPNNGLKISTVIIRNKRGERAMGKPSGTYVTIETGDMTNEENAYRESVAGTITDYLRRMVPKKPEAGILIMGLGNREITPDALGPIVVEHLLITRHVFGEYQALFPELSESVPVSALAPGVMGQTGMEAAEILKGVVSETKPAVVLVIDALAARSTERLNRTVQMTDTGISPGAGVGNNRNEISKATLGVPVIAVGVPTVVDAETIVHDRMERALQKNGLNEEEISRFLKLLEGDAKRMFVTPKDVDEAIRRIAEIIADAINRLFAHHQQEEGAEDGEDDPNGIFREEKLENTKPTDQESAIQV